MLVAGTGLMAGCEQETRGPPGGSSDDHIGATNRPNNIPVDKNGNVLLKGPAFFKAVAEQRQFTLLADTDHRDVTINEFIARKDILGGFAEAGIKHLFIETARNVQPLVGLYYRGDVTKEELSKAYISDEMWGPKHDRKRSGKAFIDVLDHCRSFGIQVHFADKPSQVTKAYPIMHATFLRAEELGDYRNPEFLDPTEKDNYSRFLQSWMTERQELTKDVAEFIRHRSHGEKSVISFGRFHSWGVRDLDELLGEASTTTVSLFGSRKAAISYDLEHGSEKDHPEYSFYIQEGKAHSLREISMKTNEISR